MSEKYQEEYVSVIDFAEMHHFSDRHIRRLLNEKKLEGRRITHNGKWLVKKNQYIKTRNEIQKRQVTTDSKLEGHMLELTSALNKLIHNFRIAQKYGSVDGLPIDEITLSEKDGKEIESIDPFLTQCLLKHVQAKLPELRGMPDWGHLRPEDMTDEFLEKLSLIAYRKDFDDTTCDICKGWR